MHRFESLRKSTKDGEKIHVTDIRVIDGDSLEVTLRSGERCEVRLAGIDADERGQQYYEHARSHLKSIAGSSAYIYVHEIDDYNRLVAEVYSEHGHKDSLNLRMISAGLARNYPDFGELEGAQSAEDEACSNSRGMWANNSQRVEPRTYRKRSREQQRAKKMRSEERKKSARLARIIEQARMRTEERQLQNAQVPEERTPVGEQATQKRLPDINITRPPDPVRKYPEDPRPRQPTFPYRKASRQRDAKPKSDKPPWQRSEEVARRDRRGMWAFENQLEPPWDYGAGGENEFASQDLELDRTYIEDIQPPQSTIPQRQEPGKRSYRPQSDEPVSSDPSVCFAILLAVFLIFLLLALVCNS